MKRLIGLSALTVALLLGFSFSDARAGETNWDAFSKNLVRALQTENDGLRQAAMQLTIKYADKLTMEDAVFDIVRIYRYHKNDNMRRLAVVTLHKIQNPWAMYFLKRSIQFEKCEAVLHQLQAVVNDYYMKKELAAARTTALAFPSLATRK